MIDSVLVVLCLEEGFDQQTLFLWEVSRRQVWGCFGTGMNLFYS